MKGKFVTNVSFATVRLINYSWDRIKGLASWFYQKYIPSQYLKRTFADFFFNI